MSMRNQTEMSVDEAHKRYPHLWPVEATEGRFTEFEAGTAGHVSVFNGWAYYHPPEGPSGQPVLSHTRMTLGRVTPFRLPPSPSGSVRLPMEHANLMVEWFLVRISDAVRADPPVVPSYEDEPGGAILATRELFCDPDVLDNAERPERICLLHRTDVVAESFHWGGMFTPGRFLELQFDADGVALSWDTGTGELSRFFGQLPWVNEEPAKFQHDGALIVDRRGVHRRMGRRLRRRRPGAN